MNDSTSLVRISPITEHERLLQLWGGYTAFIAALLVATMATSGDYPHAWLIISLLALSLPSLVAYMLLDFTVRVKQRRIGSMYRGLSLLLGFLPSLVGTTMVIGHFSVLAAVLFVVLTAFWALMIITVEIIGFRDPTSDI
jgi:hypothetical protein